MEKGIFAVSLNGTIIGYASVADLNVSIPGERIPYMAHETISVDGQLVELEESDRPGFNLSATGWIEITPHDMEKLQWLKKKQETD